MIRKTSVPELIYAWHESKQTGVGRPHMGASLIGGECDRYIWFNFRWALPPKFEGRILRLFKRGFVSEVELNTELRGIGLRVEDIDPATGKQFRFELMNGHFAGSCDGMVHGLAESPAKVHILEQKTANDRQYKALDKDGVRTAKWQHYVQMQIYMKMFHCKRALYLCVNKNDERIYDERIEYDPAVADLFINRAKNLITAAIPPQTLADGATCKYCDYRCICHGVQVPAANCRTCVHSTPQIELGQVPWLCEKFKMAISLRGQQTGGQCPGHMLMPYMMPSWLRVKDISSQGGLQYHLPDGSSLINTSEKFDGMLCLTSAKLHLLTPAMVPTVRDATEVFGSPPDTVPSSFPDIKCGVPDILPDTMPNTLPDTMPDAPDSVLVKTPATVKIDEHGTPQVVDPDNDLPF